ADAAREIQEAVTAARAGVLGGLAASVLAATVLGLFTCRAIKTVLIRMATTLDESSGQVAAASSQVSGSSQSLAQGASEHASALEETTSALEQMGSMARRNAQTAQRAADLAGDGTGRAARKDQQTISDMSSAIDAVLASADKTGKILKTIDEIAFQTNLLAL